MTAVRASSRQVWAALWVVYLVWGSTYLAIRVVVEGGLPPLLAMGARFLVAGVLLAAVLAVRRGAAALRVSRRELAAAALVGTLLLLAGNGLVAVAERTVPSGLAALLVGAVPLWMVLLRVGAGQRPRAATWAGVAVGFVGIAAISLPRGGIEGVTATGVLTVLAATVGWSIGSFLSPRIGLPGNAVVATTWEMLLGGAVMTGVGLALGEAAEVDVTGVDAATWSALAYLVVVGSLGGYTAYIWLLGHAPMSLVSTYAYVNPVVAVVLGWAILDEPITAVILAGGALTVAGVALVVRGERRPREPADVAPDQGASNDEGAPDEGVPDVDAHESNAAVTANSASLAAGSPTVTRTPSSP